MEGAIIHSTQLEKPTLTVKQDPSKFYHHFLYKGIIVAIFLVTLPLFPAQAPEFINQSLLTRNCRELLHLLFVGIAISYGLFSRPNKETDKENISKFDNTHLFVSRFLHISSFFEDGAEAETSYDSDETQVQTWSVQYHKSKPTIVVASQHSHFDQMSATNSKNCEKPLLLPVRNLKSRLCDTTGVNVSSFTLNRPTSKSGSERFSTNARKDRNIGGEIEECESPKFEDKIDVFPSPMPWRSSLIDKECPIKSNNRSPRSSLSSIKELSPSPSFSSESLPKMGYASVPLVSETASVEFFEEETASFFDKVVLVESDEDTETHEDEGVGERLAQKESSKTYKASSSRNGNEGPDVDKKADAFIAKFREQILLQRVDSIKTSAREILQGNFEDPK